MPSKKVLSILIISISFIVAMILTFGKDKSAKVIDIAKNITPGENISIPENNNWEKELNNIYLATNNTNSTSTKETTTDIVSRSIVSNYLALDQSGKIDQNSIQTLVDKASDYINQTNNQNVSKISTLPKTIQDNGNQTIYDYGENLGLILRSNNSEKLKKEMFDFKKYAEEENTKALELLPSIIKSHEKLRSDLVNMQVPQRFVKPHIDIVNGLTLMISGLNESSYIFNDPIRALGAIEKYGSGMNLTSSSLKSIADFIINNKIVYKQGSGGYYLLYGI